MQKKKNINLILVILWMTFIFVMSSFDATDSSNQSGFIVNIITKIIPIININNLGFIIRKLAHFSEYLILGILVYNLLYDINYSKSLSLVICILYAISDEIHQLYIPGRSCQITDVLIDSTGALFGIIIIYVIKMNIKNSVKFVYNSLNKKSSNLNNRSKY